MSCTFCEPKHYSGDYIPKKNLIATNKPEHTIYTYIRKGFNGNYLLCTDVYSSNGHTAKATPIKFCPVCGRGLLWFRDEFPPLYENWTLTKEVKE